ncbi:hypothetical protein DFJ77DRAFT_448112 [Powellomyces hirtus]|nr:hypothetical protein DFJ77DRAFT_448112 [Powellomyces hirtus]
MLADAFNLHPPHHTPLAPPADIASDGALLIGPASSKKSSLLLHYALSRARDAAGWVVYIVPAKNRTKDKESMRVERPYEVGNVGVGLDVGALGRIHVRYIPTLASLQQFLVWLPHLHPPLGISGSPRCVVVDGFDWFFEQVGVDDVYTQASHTLAGLMHTADHIRNVTNSPCSVMVSIDSTPTTPPLQLICERFLRWTVMLAGTHPTYRISLTQAETYSGMVFRTAQMTEGDAGQASEEVVVVRVDDERGRIVVV